MMDRYWVWHNATNGDERRSYYVMAKGAGSTAHGKPHGAAAVCEDAEMAQRIADALNCEDAITEALLTGSGFYKVPLP
jgi:hypothetical protein